MISFVVPGPAVPWKRAAPVHGVPRTITVQRDYQRHVRACASLAVALCPGWKRDARYRLRVDYYPQNMVHRDTSNVLKTLEDACNGVLWDDDWQIDDTVIKRHWDERRNPRLEVHVERL